LCFSNVWSSQSWLPAHIEHSQKAIERVVEESGVSFRGHDLRRTAASLMVGAGVPRLVVSKILNHVETGVTAVYDRLATTSKSGLHLSFGDDASKG
jgi:integrase